MKSRLPIPALFFWLLTLATGSCAAYEFTIEGEIKIRGYRQGQLEGETNYNFIAEIRDCSSRIRVFGAWFSASEFMEYGWDMTNSYLFIQLRADRESKVVYEVSNGEAKAITLDKPVKSQNDATLSLYPGELPQYGYGIEPVWLAYASACRYKDRKSGHKVEPVWRMGDKVREANILFTSSWQMNKAAPHLLEFMADFTDGKKYESTGSKSVPAGMPKPFDVETTNSVYQVLSWTNVSGMILPDRFQVTRYVPDTQASTPSLLELEVYEGIAHSIRPTCAITDFSPKVTGAIPTQIYDHRLALDSIPVRVVSYFSADGKVANLDDLKNRGEYRQAIKTVKPKLRGNDLRYLMIGIFALASIIPLWILAKGKQGAK